MNPDPHERLTLLQTKRPDHPTEVFSAAHELVTLLSRYNDPEIGLSEAGGIEFHYTVSVLSVFIDLHVNPLEYTVSSVTPHTFKTGKPDSVAELADIIIQFCRGIIGSLLQEKLSKTPNTLFR